MGQSRRAGRAGQAGQVGSVEQDGVVRGGRVGSGVFHTDWFHWVFSFF